jgi:RNA recognition motif-containing protein
MSGEEDPQPAQEATEAQKDDKVDPKPTATIYIGNLDKRMREIHILKLFQPFGKVKNFQFLFTKEGEPRGYMFLTYEKREHAVHAMKKLRGKMAMGKPLKIRFANADPQKKLREAEKPKQAITTPKEAKIQAIQRKLKQLEQHKVPSTVDASKERTGPPERSNASKNVQKRHHPYMT